MTVLFASQKNLRASVFSQSNMSQEDAVCDTAVPPKPPVLKTPSDEQAPLVADKTDEPSFSPSRSSDPPEYEPTSEGVEVGASVSHVPEPPENNSDDHSCDQVSECIATVSLEPEVAEGEVEVGYIIVCDHDNVFKRM